MVELVNKNIFHNVGNYVIILGTLFKTYRCFDYGRTALMEVIPETFRLTKSNIYVFFLYSSST